MSLTDNRNHKVKCKFGMNDYIRHYNKTSDNPVDNKIARKVICEYLELNKDLVSATGYNFKLPEQCGKIEIRKVKREVTIDKDGNVVNKLPINWKATNKLWAENQIAKDKKIRLRYTNEHTDGYVFHLYFIKKNATFKNKSIYKLQINRDMIRNTYEGIMSKKLDAFLLY